MKKISLLILSIACSAAIATGAQSTDSTALADSAVLAAPQVCTTPQEQAETPQADTADNTPLFALAAVLALLTVWALVSSRKTAATCRRQTDQLQQHIDRLQEEIKQTSEQTTKLAESLEKQIAELAKLTQQHREKPQKTVNVIDKQEHSNVKADSYPKTIYLSKPDTKGRFLREASAFEPGNSIFVLTTPNGITGTFQVVDNKEMQRLALMLPTENLTTACTGPNIQTSAGANIIVTDVPGTATFSAGHWQITTQALIHYEA